MPYKQSCILVTFTDTDGVTHFLMGRHKRFAKGKRIEDGRYMFPGGGIEDEETPEHCALRELEEETNLDLTDKIHPFSNEPLKVKQLFPSRFQKGVAVFHVHLGKLDSDQQKKLKSKIKAKDDLAVAEFVSAKEVNFENFTVKDVDAYKTNINIMDKINRRFTQTEQSTSETNYYKQRRNQNLNNWNRGRAKQRVTSNIGKGSIFKPKPSTKKESVIEGSNPQPINTNNFQCSPNFISNKNVAFLNQFFKENDLDWEVREKKNTNTTEPFRTVYDEADNPKFRIYTQKLTTDDNDVNTFIIMLRTFKKLNGNKGFPKIMTYPNAQNAWRDAFKAVYKDHKQNLNELIITKQPVQEKKKHTPITKPVSMPQPLTP